MQTLILSLHVIVCITLVILILLQAGKEGMGVIFGGGNASVFGSSGAGGLLAKMTAFMATTTFPAPVRNRNPPFSTSVWKTRRSPRLPPQPRPRPPLPLKSPPSSPPPTRAFALRSRKAMKRFMAFF